LHLFIYSKYSRKMADDICLSEANTKLIFGNEHADRKLLITVCIHGNETCGLVAVNELIEEGFFSDGFDTNRTQVTIILGNPRALKENKRFIDINMNRIFTPQFIESEMKDDMLGKELYEVSHLQKITAAIQNCTAYLDLHSTSAPTIPFAIVFHGEESLCNLLSVRFLIQNVIKVIVGTSIDYAHSLGIPSICVECGQHISREAVEVAKRNIGAFVTEHPFDHFPKKHLYVDRSVILRKGFRFMKNVKAFDWVNHNEVVAQDDVVGDIKCPYNPGAFLVMPVANPVLGEEAWVWGHTPDVWVDSDMALQQKLGQLSLKDKKMGGYRTFSPCSDIGRKNIGGKTVSSHG